MIKKRGWRFDIRPSLLLHYTLRRVIPAGGRHLVDPPGHNSRRRDPAPAPPGQVILT